MKFKNKFILSFLFLAIFSSQNNLLISKEIIDSDNLIKENIQDDLFILGEGDIININVTGAKELSGKVTIINDGTISIPTIGSIKIAGLTIDSATKKLEKALSSQLLQSDAQIIIISPRPVRVAVIGEVSRPGIYLLSNNNNNNDINVVKSLPTLVDAIQQSGGLTKKADLQSVYLKRKIYGTNAEYKRAELNLFNLIKKGELFQNPILFDGDVITVNKINPNQVSDKSYLITKSNLYPDFISINVVGEVRNPGEVKLRNNSSLVKGILAAGGPKRDGANTGSVKLLRVLDNGKHSVKSFKYDLRRQISDKKNPMLLDGDTLIVNESLFGKTTGTIGAVAKPASGIVQIWTLLKLINDE